MQKVDLEERGSLVVGVWFGDVSKWVIENPEMNKKHMELGRAVMDSAQSGDEAIFNENVRALKNQRIQWQAEYKERFLPIKCETKDGGTIVFGNPGTAEFEFQKEEEDNED